MVEVETSKTETTVYKDEHLEVDFRTGRAYVNSNPMVLTRKEFELLALLVENQGEILPREILMKRIWGYSMEIRTRTLDVHIRRLRQKLGGYGEQCIETIFGVGYRFQRRREPRIRSTYLGQCVAVPA
ncbi:MAG: winged helix-turn-helix domain-containing protein [Bryobacteraceae bacterium]